MTRCRRNFYWRKRVKKRKTSQQNRLWWYVGIYTLTQRSLTRVMLEYCKLSPVRLSNRRDIIVSVQGRELDLSNRDSHVHTSLVPRFSGAISPHRFCLGVHVKIAEESHTHTARHVQHVAGLIDDDVSPPLRRHTIPRCGPFTVQRWYTYTSVVCGLLLTNVPPPSRHETTSAWVRERSYVCECVDTHFFNPIILSLLSFNQRNTRTRIHAHTNTPRACVYTL